MKRSVISFMIERAARKERLAFLLNRMNSSFIEYIRGIQVVKTFTRSTGAYHALLGHQQRPSRGQLIIVPKSG